MNHNSLPPTAKDKKIEGTNQDPRRNIPPKKSHHTLLSSEDDNDQAAVQPRKNVCIGTKKRILESEDEDDNDQAPSSPVQPRSKKVRVDSKKKRHCSATVEEDQEVDTNSKNICRKKNNKKLTGESKKSSKTRKNGAGNDSDIEIIEKLQETPEKELGM